MKSFWPLIIMGLIIYIVANPGSFEGMGKTTSQTNEIDMAGWFRYSDPSGNGVATLNMDKSYYCEGEMAEVVVRGIHYQEYSIGISEDGRWNKQDGEWIYWDKVYVGSAGNGKKLIALPNEGDYVVRATIKGVATTNIENIEVRKC